VNTGKGTLHQSWLSHKDLLSSGTIRIDLSDKPTTWGVSTAPPAINQN
jgi:putative alpha-1,2-mannosidase